MAKHHIMDQTGHSTIEFDEKNLADLAAAEARFKEMMEKGYTPAVRGEDGKATVTRSFDPTAQETLFVPQLVGG